MANTPILQLPEITHGEVNGDVTHNESLWKLDIHGQQIIVARLTAQPGSPANGEAWIVLPGATGSEWSGQDNKIAHYYNSSWKFYTPFTGWRFFVMAEQTEYAWTGSAWESISPFGVFLGGTVSTFTLDATDSKLINYTLGGVWNWENATGINPTAGEITVPKTGYYRHTFNMVGQQGNTIKEEDIFLKLDVVGGPSPGRTEVAVQHVSTDKGLRVRQLQTVYTRERTVNEVLSLYMAATAGLGTFTPLESTFEIAWVSHSADF